MTTKPRLKRLGPGNWQCADDALARCGKNADQAYHRWLMASLRQVMASPPKKRGRPLGSTKPPEPTPAPPATAKPVQAAPPQPAPPAMPTYPESIVHQVPGTRVRPAYVPPLPMRINIARAAQSQPAISGQHDIGTGLEHSKVWRRSRCPPSRYGYDNGSGLRVTCQHHKP